MRKAIFSISQVRYKSALNFVLRILRYFLVEVACIAAVGDKTFLGGGRGDRAATRKHTIVGQKYFWGRQTSVFFCGGGAKIY